MVCTSLGSLLRPLFYFLCSNLKANPVLISKIQLNPTQAESVRMEGETRSSDLNYLPNKRTSHRRRGVIPALPSLRAEFLVLKQESGILRHSSNPV